MLCGKRKKSSKKVQIFPLTCRGLEADYGNKFFGLFGR